METSDEDLLLCPTCGGSAVQVRILDNGALRLICTTCNRVIAFAADLIRVL